MSRTITSNSTLIDSVERAQSYTSASIDCKVVQAFSVQISATPSTPAAKNFLAGESAIETITFDTQANTGDGDYVVVYDTTGQPWAVAADKTGASAEPTGAVWTAIAAAFKAQADISGATTAADVAAAFETAFDGITNFTSTIVSDDSAADGTMTMTTTIRGPVTATGTYDEDDGTSGSISAATTNAGVASTVDVAANTITISSHGLATGLVGQLTTTDTLPSGVTTSTNYYVIVVDDDTIQLASSLANAVAGTDIDLTDQGTDGATHTFTATTSASNNLKLQRSNDGTNWDDISGASTTINTTAVVDTYAIDVATSRYYRIVYTPSSGQTTFSAVLHQILAQ